MMRGELTETLTVLKWLKNRFEPTFKVINSECNKNYHKLFFILSLPWLISRNWTEFGSFQTFCENILNDLFFKKKDTKKDTSCDNERKQYLLYLKIAFRNKPVVSFFGKKQGCWENWGFSPGSVFQADSLEMNPAVHPVFRYFTQKHSYTLVWKA